jgi:two-component sensor histidine kinase
MAPSIPVSRRTGAVNDANDAFEAGARGVVAVVNDDHVTLTRLESVLEREGLSVLPFGSAEQLLDARDAVARADLIITDLHMPDIDGWRLVRLLRSAEYAAFNETPIMVVSATFSGTDTAKITEEIGADAFLESPVDPGELSRHITALLRGKSATRAPRALIIDDSPTLVQLLATTLGSAGYLVDTAATVSAARETFRPGGFDVAVVDYHLPDGTGEELITHFREVDSSCVSVAVTTDTDPGLAVSLMRSGAAAYIRKPFRPDYLLEVCARARRERALLRVEELLEARTAELRESERQKALLLREVHHRMKNDMQLVQGTLMLQAERCEEPGARQMLEDSVTRVGVMARIYDTLYGREDFEHVDARSLIETLAAGLRRTTLREGITLDIDADALEIRTELSTSLGLIVNELITNAAKHAFHGVDAPRIRITLHRAGDDHVRLTVADNGNGMPAVAGGTRASGFGMEMLSALVDQHHGTLDIHSSAGTRIDVTLML